MSKRSIGNIRRVAPTSSCGDVWATVAQQRSSQMDLVTAMASAQGAAGAPSARAGGVCAQLASLAPVLRRLPRAWRSIIEWVLRTVAWFILAAILTAFVLSSQQLAPACDDPTTGLGYLATGGAA